MKYHALFIAFEKAAKFDSCRLLQIIGGALRVNTLPAITNYSSSKCMCKQNSPIRVYLFAFFKNSLFSSDHQMEASFLAKYV